MIRTASRLVTQRPHEHRRMVPVSYSHSYHSLHEWINPLRSVGQIASLMMSFKISLIHYVYTILIAQFIEIRVVRIVRCADCIEVITLHKQNVFEHLITCNGLSSGLAMVMAVYTNEFNRSVIHQNLITCYFNIPEPYLITSRIHHVALFVCELYNQSV